MYERPGPPHPPPHPQQEWIVNLEKTYPLATIAERLQQIGKLLAERGDVRLEDVVVKPSDPCFFMLRYERMPRGELSLKIELQWSGEQGAASATPEKEITIK